MVDHVSFVDHFDFVTFIYSFSFLYVISALVFIISSASFGFTSSFSSSFSCKVRTLISFFIFNVSVCSYKFLL